MRSNLLPPLVIEVIVQDYINGLSQDQIEKKYRIDHKILSRWLAERGIERRKYTKVTKKKPVYKRRVIWRTIFNPKLDEKLKSLLEDQIEL